MTDQLAAILLAVVLGGAGGLFVPRLILGLPEPEPDPEERDEAPKELYAVIGASPGLAWKSAVAAALAGAVVGWSVGLDWPLLYLVPLTPVGVALAVVDWRTRYLPTRLIAPTYVGLVLLVLVCWLVTRDTDDLVRAGLGWALLGGYFLLFWLIYPRGLGYGDVRLSGVIGIALGYLGWGELVIGFVGAFLFLAVAGVVSLLRGRRKQALPFGPFMLLGALAGIAWGADLWSAYLGPGAG